MATLSAPYRGSVAAGWTRLVAGVHARWLDRAVGLLLLVVYWLGRRYWNRAVGLAAVAMLAVSDPFLVSTHTLRPDVQVITMILGALLLAERAVERAALLWAFASGLLLGLV